MNKINYQKLLDAEILKVLEKDLKPKLLLHACCAPCSSYVLDYLSKYFKITVYYYNPNIATIDEYNYRASELNRFIKEINIDDIDLVIEKYNHDEFLNNIKGMEAYKEGGARCFKCYRLRLEKSTEYAVNNKFDYITTTLSISPLKNAEKLNEIGMELAEKYNINYLFSDFKKKDGYKKSVELSNKYNLYRQNYCGCEFSKSHT